MLLIAVLSFCNTGSGVPLGSESHHIGHCGHPDIDLPRHDVIDDIRGAASGVRHDDRDRFVWKARLRHRSGRDNAGGRSGDKAAARNWVLQR